MRLELWIAYSVVSLVGLAAAFVVYQAILLPSLRQELRFRLFRLRDELRGLVTAGELREESPAFDVLHSHLNAMVQVLPKCDPVLLRSITDKEKETLNRRLDKLDTALESHPEAAKIYFRGIQLLVYAFIANAPFAAIYLIFFTSVEVVREERRKARLLSRVEDEVRPVFAMKEHDLESSGLITSPVW